MNTWNQPAINTVSIGGGSGLAHLLLGLKHYVKKNRRGDALSAGPFAIDRLTAVVTVTDDGGSSGRLREEFQILPPGDIRKCLVALSEDELLMSKLFQYRFSGGGDLQGHSFGNLFLTALANVTGDFLEAIRLSTEVLAIQGRILPSTMADVRLIAELENGAAIFGESLIGRSPVRIRRVSIFPESCDPLPETLEAIAEAEIVTMGPGSLYTSLLPSLLVRGIPEAIRKSSATKIYIANLMTQLGETLGFSASDHLEAIKEHISDFPFDYVLCNLTPISQLQRQNYLGEQATQIETDLDRMKAFGVKIVLKDLLAVDEKVRHDPIKLAQAISEVHLASKQSNLISQSRFEPVV
ncbi:MAG TPA: gluconeogenesis factor YvcK family protein [Terriglobia bacterium]|nr:gluconeogenesis factor YvcK family protein [Terriglobia bacterium]